ENKKQFGIHEYWHEFWSLVDKFDINNRSEYTDDEFCDALACYRLQDIKENIASDNPLIRMFAVLDRRLGKRRLQKLKTEISKQPLWLRQFYELRISAEL
ncbi:MAG: hypothetical protein IKJ50_05685, partial [Clostridia bacterium]|nr:hypothetical protein [Clostridia bacterium]